MTPVRATLHMRWAEASSTVGCRSESGNCQILDELGSSGGRGLSAISFRSKGRERDGGLVVGVDACDPRHRRTGHVVDPIYAHGAQVQD